MGWPIHRRFLNSQCSSFRCNSKFITINRLTAENIAAFINFISATLQQRYSQVVLKNYCNSDLQSFCTKLICKVDVTLLQSWCNVAAKLMQRFYEVSGKLFCKVAAKIFCKVAAKLFCKVASTIFCKVATKFFWKDTVKLFCKVAVQSCLTKLLCKVALCSFV